MAALEAPKPNILLLETLPEIQYIKIYRKKSGLGNSTAEFWQ